MYTAKAPAAQLPLAQAVVAYRSPYLIEPGMGRLKGRPMPLTPMYLERDDPVTGLIRLLAIGLRVLTLLEFVVHRRRAAARTMPAGLYAGNPTPAPARNTAFSRCWTSRWLSTRGCMLIFINCPNHERPISINAVLTHGGLSL